ncbi:MAG: hypothetical protein ACI4Q9_04120 [Candidatus Methanomethylophilaceae archaeon]
MCMKKANPKASVCISNEYGTLREAVVGIGSGMYGNGIGWDDGDADTRASAFFDRENEELASVLKGCGVDVVRPGRLSKDDIESLYGKGAADAGYNQAFPRDNVFIVANDLIEFELRDASRKTDIAGLYGILQNKSKDPEVCWYSTPHCPLRITPDDYPMLNGRDFIYLDNRILIGQSRERDIGTNSEGFRWMRNTFAFHDVTAVFLKNGLTDLGQAMSVPRPGLAIVCRDGIEDLPSFMKDWDMIDITPEEALSFAAEGIAVSDSEYITGVSEEFDNGHVISELEKRGIKVHKIDFPAHMSFGGSVRAAVLPLRRELE